MRHAALVTGLVLLALRASPAQAQVACAGDIDAHCECESLFAYRVLEKAVDAGGTPANCDDALGVDVGSFLYGGVLTPMCLASQTANECRDAWYATPPDVASLGGGGKSHRAQWVPRCADGTDSCATDEAVCQDGTRPLIYVDKAVDMAGADMHSNGWIFYLGGEGGPCSESPQERNGQATSHCWNNYRFGGTKDDNAFKRAMSSMHPDFGGPTQSKAVSGLLDDVALFDGTAYNNFRHFNRIKLERCSDWASDAEEMNTVIPMSPLTWGTQLDTDQVNVWHRGHHIVSAIFNFLTTSAGRDIDDDGVVDLPTLANATTVLLAGSSDSTIWLISIADQLRTELEALNPNVEVKIVVDGLFDPMLENEARYNANPMTSIFDAPFDNSLGELLPVGVDPAAGRDYSNTNYAVGGTSRESWSRRNTFIDASCEASHGAGAMECYDKLHVLLNHVDTSFLIYAEQNDSVASDNLAYADDRAYQPEAIEYRTRVRDQAEDIELAWGARADEAGLAAPANPERSYVVPYGTRHVHLGDNTQMAKEMTECTDDGLGGWNAVTVPFAEMLHRWLIYGTEYFAIEDDRGAAPLTSTHWVTGDGITTLCGHPRRNDGTPVP